MTVVCPHGHRSSTPDYCDECGALIAEPAEPLELPDSVEPEETDTSPAARREPCPVCRTARSGDDRFCEQCGYDFASPPPGSIAWEAVVSADRRQFERFAVPGLTFPDGHPERRFPLDGDRMLIGCRRGGPGEQPPEIDLAVAPVDPGVSRRHAILERQDDGSYAVRDLGSTNGTTVNDAQDPIAPDQPVQLSDGDTVRLGVWTMLTIRNRAASAGLS